MQLTPCEIGCSRLTIYYIVAIDIMDVVNWWYYTAKLSFYRYLYLRTYYVRSATKKPKRRFLFPIGEMNLNKGLRSELL